MKPSEPMALVRLPRRKMELLVALLDPFRDETGEGGREAEAHLKASDEVKAPLVVAAGLAEGLWQARNAFGSDEIDEPLRRLGG
jgi:hypothetical protein